MSRKKGNQYRAKITRYYGHESQDFEDKQRVRKHLEKRGFAHIATSAYVGIRPDDTYHAFNRCTKAFASQFRKVRHPDVLAWKTVDSQPIIIEIDGGCHADLDTDPDYEAIKIKYLKLNKKYLAAEEESWEDAIDFWLESFMPGVAS